MGWLGLKIGWKVGRNNWYFGLIGNSKWSIKIEIGGMRSTNQWQ